MVIDARCRAGERAWYTAVLGCVLRVFLALILVTHAALAQPAAGIRGDAAALAAARRLVESAGGTERWRSRSFELRERGYLNNGNILEMRIAYDFEQGARLIETTSLGKMTTEWLAPGAGWFERDAEMTHSSASDLAINLQAVQQEPYPIFHRIARNDPRLRVELRNSGAALYVYDADERLLCWFGLWPNGQARSWANFYNGVINQQFYGPAGRVGQATLPLWGVQQDGSYRFEHLGARFGNEPLVAPR